MDASVRSAHQELDDELHQLGVAYRRSLEEASILYQQGVAEAQVKYESRLRAAMQSMTDAIQESLSTR